MNGIKCLLLDVPVLLFRKNEKKQLSYPLSKKGNLNDMLMGEPAHFIKNFIHDLDTALGILKPNAKLPPMSTYLSPVKFYFRRQKWPYIAKNLKYNQ